MIVRALDIKLMRDVRRLWAQVLAIALVMAAGAATLILGAGAYDSLYTTRETYYEQNRFADVFASATRAPKALMDEISAIEGVAAAEPRIVKMALVDIEGVAEPASILLVSLPDFHPPILNRLYLRAGRMPEPRSTNEAVVSEAFAKAHAFRIGSAFHALINGKRREIRVSGIALSPEFIYAIGPGDLMPDDRRFGIVWMPEAALADAYDLHGAFSNVIVKLLPGASENAVISRMDALLAKYGGTGAHGRKDHTSHAFIDAELKQLRAMSRILPPIFLVVSAFLVNMTLARLIALEREQIGLLKAIGYSSWSIARHYLAFASVIAVAGIIIGFAAGTWLGNGMAQLYAKFFHFPFLVFTRDPAIYWISAATSVLSAIIGALRAVSGAAWLPPAVAMSPPAPAQYRKLLGGLFDLSRGMRQSTVMISRHLLRWPTRTAASIAGMALSVSILVGSLWSFGSVDFMIDVTFQRSDRQDATINFSDVLPYSALYSVARLPGVMAAEPYRAVAVKVRNGSYERRISLSGKPGEADLSRVLGLDLRPVRMPESGIALSDTLAGVLKARPGDIIEVEILEGDRRTVRQPVTAIIQGYLGLMAYMDIGEMNRMLGEGEMISGVHIGLDDIMKHQLFVALKATPTANFIALQRVSLKKFRETLAENILIMITVYAGLASIIAFGVVYNFARISLSEQGRELASLRVLGFTRGEVSGLLLKELAIIVLVAQIPGWLIGYGFAYAMVQGFSTELYRVPLVVNRDVYAYSSLAVFVAAAVSALVVRRRIDRLNMIEVLKTRE